MASSFFLWSILAVIVHCEAGMSSPISMSERIDIIIAVKNYFRSGCIFFLDFSNQKIIGSLYQELLVGELKQVSKQVAVMTLPVDSDLAKTRCPRNRPLLIMSEFQEANNQLQLLNNIYMSDFFWLAFLDANSELDDLFTGVNIPFDCQFLAVQRNGDVIFVTEIYRISPKLSIQQYQFGTWSSVSGLTWPKIGLYERRNNLQGLVIKAGFREESPVAVFKDKKRKATTGLLGEVWKLLERQMNFSTDYYSPNDNAYGGKMENGSWTGVIGMLQRYEVDYSVIDFFLLKDRLEAADYTVPVFITKYILIIREPSKFQLQWNTFLLPFASDFWAALFIAMLLCIICLAAGFHVKFGEEDGVLGSSLITATFHTLGIICQQGSGILPKSTAVRLTFLTLHLTSVVLFASYSAAYISYVTLRKPTLPFTNFEEFLHDGSYKLEMMPNSAALEYFKSSRVELLRDIYKKMVLPHESTLPHQDLIGLQRICSGNKYAFFTSSYRIMLIGPMANCNFVLIPRAYCPGTVAFTTTKRNSYRRLFNHKLQELRRDGTLTGVFKRFSYRLRYMKGIHTPTVNITDVAPILIVLLVGTFISVSIFTIEFWVRKLFLKKKFTLSSRKKSCK